MTAVMDTNDNVDTMDNNDIADRNSSSTRHHGRRSRNSSSDSSDSPDRSRARSPPTLHRVDGRSDNEREPPQSDGAPLHEVVGPAHPHAHVGQAAHAPKAEGGHLRGAIPAPRYVRAGPRNDDECRPVHRVLIRVLRTVHPRTSENTDVLDASAATAGARRNLVTNTTVRDTRPVIHHPPVRRALRAATRQK